MAPSKKDFDKLAWSWIETTTPEQIERAHLESAYRIELKKCKNCRRNCANNPRCLTGLGEEKYIKSKPAEIVPIENSLSELRDPTQYVGLENLGATCYVNSLIQVWYHNDDMRRIIYKWDIAEDPEERKLVEESKKKGETYHSGTAVGQLQYIFATMQFGNRKLVDPTNLAIALSLDIGAEQDAQEFSKLLLCHIEDKLQQNRELKEMLQRLSQGKYSYVNCCTTCGTEYATTTTFYELDLQLAATLKEALDKYLTEEELTGADQYLCATCNDKKDARRFIRLDSLPETLNIQLLRFVYLRDSGEKKKLNSFIQFPEDLDMSEYLRCPPQTHLYSLVAVLSHKGPSAHSGHYIANICNSNGEWYQFSDDKVEKIRNKRIEDGLNDVPKNVKRGRVPKGFLSSNTAYMLVYKKKSPNSRSNNGRRNKSAKVEKLPIGDTVELSDRTKKPVDGDEVPVSPEPAKPDNKENSTETDYQKLNGKAHRAMSLGQRDIYEEKEFIKWEVSETVRELVKEENVTYELRLLDIQQGKQKEILEQNEKRQQVIDFYNVVANTTSWTEYQWVATDWLSKWLNGQSSVGAISPIDNSSLLCKHGKLDPLRVNRVKCIPVVAAEMLHQKYRGGPRLDQNDLCEDCVKQRCKTLRFKMVLERDHKEVIELVRNFKEPTESSYLVGSESLKYWKRLAMDEFTQRIEDETKGDPDQRSDETKASKDQEDSPKEGGEGEADEDEDDDSLINFNEDLLCEHGSLKTPVSGRKIIPQEAWIILRNYFPDAKEYPLGAPTCSICEERIEFVQRSKEDDKIKAKQQKDALSDLYYGRSRNEIIKCEDPNALFYLVEKGFLDSWRSFIRYVETHGRTPPTRIQNSVLLCDQHKGLLYQPSGASEQYSILSEQEWTRMLQFYEVDHVITVKKSSKEFVTDPGPCAVCILARVEQERIESLKYDRATIYIKCIDDGEDPKSENDNEISAKRPKMDSKRPTRTRKVKGSHELKVSSTITLKQLKVMTMQICGAGPYDQHLMLGDHELLDHELSLAALGIFPGALLTLKIDLPKDSDGDVEAISSLESASPEKGFKGTELVLS